MRLCSLVFSRWCLFPLLLGTTGLVTSASAAMPGLPFTKDFFNQAPTIAACVFHTGESIVVKTSGSGFHRGQVHGKPGRNLSRQFQFGNNALYDSAAAGAMSWSGLLVLFAMSLRKKRRKNAMQRAADRH